MVEQLKLEEVSNNKLEKNATKGRGSASPFKAKGSGSPFKPKGSGSPFKCIGLGYQLKCEKDEENNAERLRIEELEALAASKQKEVGYFTPIFLQFFFYYSVCSFSPNWFPFPQIFMLNSRLASAESMTHDVIRDLLGVKLDMSSYMVRLCIPCMVCLESIGMWASR